MFNLAVFQKNFLWVSYVFFAVSALTASFGAAVLSISLGFLVLASLMSWVTQSQNKPLLFAEKIGMYLIAWLCLSEVLSGHVTGVYPLLSEYRFFWLGPLVAIALLRWLTPLEIATPVAVSLMFYWLGSMSMTVLDDPLAISEYKKVVQNNGGSHLSLGGKFVNGLISVLSIGALLGFTFRSQSKVCALMLLSLAIAISAYTILIENGRTGYFLVFSCWASALTVAALKNLKIALSILVIFLIGVYVAAVDPTVKSQVTRILQSADAFFEHGAVTSSTGQRLQGFVLIAEHSEIESVIFGEGYTGGRIKLAEWADAGQLIGEPVKSLNLHSDVAHLILYGGLIAFLGYVLFAIAILYMLAKSVARSDWLTASLASSLLISVYISGVLNSTLLDLRERAVLLVIFIVFLSIARTSYEQEYINAKK